MEAHFKRNLWVSLAVIGGNAIIFAILTGWLLSQYKAQAEGIFRYRTTIAGASALLRSLSIVKQQIPEMEGYELKLYALLPSEEELITFKRSIDTLAGSAGVRLDFSYRGRLSEPTVDSPGQVGFNIGFSGPYDGIMTFLRQIEVRSSRNLLRLDSLSLNLSSDGSYSGSAIGRIFVRAPNP